ncbi:DUF5675 family protein [Sphingobacterium multivorum]|uniref:DUF5675 family protein n=1 Tax=Sphingobacterium multivorum TaxID=28454 RepID=UPI0028B2611F|nr:DUF5675 family protein [Sphingobacterium multivorum]
MELTLKRVRQGNNSTLSELYINGTFQCYGLEDTVRDVKIKGRTAIPAGTYKLGLNLEGSMNAAYKKRFPAMHEGMIEIRNISHFSLVYIHIGNTHEDTEGCLLVGTYFHRSNDDWGVYQSAEAYKQLYQTIIEMVKNGGATLIIENRFRG